MDLNTALLCWLPLPRLRWSAACCARTHREVRCRLQSLSRTGHVSCSCNACITIFCSLPHYPVYRDCKQQRWQNATLSNTSYHLKPTADIAVDSDCTATLLVEFLNDVISNIDLNPLQYVANCSCTIYRTVKIFRQYLANKHTSSTVSYICVI